MKFYETLKSSDCEILNEEENFKVYKLRLNLQSLETSFIEKIRNTISTFVSESIVFEASLSDENYDLLSISNESAHNLEEKLESIDLDDLDNLQNAEFDLAIYKKTADSFNIFDVSLFCNTLKDYDFEKLLSEWESLISDKVTYIDIWGDAEEINSRSLAIKSKFKSRSCKAFNPITISQRERLLENRDKACHFANGRNCRLVPEDFYLYEKETTNPIYTTLISLANILTISFLADYSIVENSKIQYKLKGYKQISGTLDVELTREMRCFSNENIYKWVYDSGNFVDKIGLARNLISIHLSDKDNLLTTEAGTESSIRSSFELYLKDNLKQYIEIKNKISESLQAQSEKASTITRNMFAGFKSSFWTCSTFIIGTLILKLSKFNSEGLSEDIKRFGYFLVVLSLCYLFLNWLEVKREKGRLKDAYSKIKSNYEKIMEESDLDSILDFRNTRDKDVKHIDSFLKIYGLVWIATNALFIYIIHLVS